MTAFLIMAVACSNTVAQGGGKTSTLSSVIVGQLITTSNSGRSAWVRCPQGHAPQLEDRVIFLRQATLLAEGLVGVRTDSDAAVQITWQSEPLKSDDQALLLPSDLAARFRQDLPAPITLRGQLMSIGPGRANGWVNLGKNQGLVLGDHLIVLHDQIDMAVARIAALDADRAFVTLNPLVADLRPAPGAVVQLWPDPAFARAGIIPSQVLHADPASTESLITIAGGAEVGFEVGDEIEIRRAGDYVGLGRIERVDERLAQLRMIDAFTRRPPAQGDLAIQRGPEFADSANIPGQSGRIFRVEGNYCLVNLGEQNGIERGQRLVVIRQGNEIAELSVRTVKVDYCGADIQNRPSEPISPWDEVFAKPFSPSRVIQIARTDQTSGSGRCRRITLTEFAPLLRPGQILLLGSSAPPEHDKFAAAALVLAVADRRAVVWTPPCWTNGPIVGREVWMKTNARESSEDRNPRNKN